MWFRVPKSIKFNITGKLQDGVMGRDVFEYILGQIGPAGAVYQAMEFTGQVVEDMSLDGRLSMCCLSILPARRPASLIPTKKYLTGFKHGPKFIMSLSTATRMPCMLKTYTYDGSKIEAADRCSAVPAYRPACFIG